MYPIQQLKNRKPGITWKQEIEKTASSREFCKKEWTARGILRIPAHSRQLVPASEESMSSRAASSGNGFRETLKCNIYPFSKTAHTVERKDALLHSYLKRPKLKYPALHVYTLINRSSLLKLAKVTHCSCYIRSAVGLRKSLRQY